MQAAVTVWIWVLNTPLMGWWWFSMQRAVVRSMIGWQWSVCDCWWWSLCILAVSLIHVAYISSWVARRGWPSIASCDQTTSVGGICRRLITHRPASWRPRGTQSASTPGPAVAAAARRGRAATDRWPGWLWTRCRPVLPDAIHHWSTSAIYRSGWLIDNVGWDGLGWNRELVQRQDKCIVESLAVCPLGQRHSHKC